MTRRERERDRLPKCGVLFVGTKPHVIAKGLMVKHVVKARACVLVGPCHGGKAESSAGPHRFGGGGGRVSRSIY